MNHLTPKQMLMISYMSSFVGLGAAYTFWLARALM